MSEPVWSDSAIDLLVANRAIQAPDCTYLFEDDVRRLLLNMQNDYEAELAQLRAQVAAANEVIAYIDEIVPRADDTCVEPGITLSEAARRVIRDEQRP